MSLSDPIGDMIARIKNSQARNHKIVELPSSSFKSKIADILKKLGQIDLLKDMKNLDPDRMDFYQESIDSISE